MRHVPLARLRALLLLPALAATCLTAAAAQEAAPASAPASAAAPSDEPPLALPEGVADCLACHADASLFAELAPTAAGESQRFVVDESLYGRSVHGAMSCADCHMGFEEAPHVAADVMSMQCANCHEDSAVELADSAHANPGPDGRAASCTDCHGIHDVLPPEDRASRMHPLNVYQACGQCHFSVDPRTATVDELMREPYSDDAHAHGLLNGGLIGSATCVSCHGGHDIRPHGDPDSSVSRQNVANTCGACHVGVLEQYQQSVHAVRSSGPEHQGASCTDCHKPHGMEQATGSFRSQTVQSCGECHAASVGTFELSYHGKQTTLGSTDRVATCSACHGDHQIQPILDERSLVHPSNIVGTCAQCHEGSHAEFATYQVHADPRDPTKDPRLHLLWQIMRGLLIGVLILGGTHVLLWLNRAIAAGGLKRKRHQGGRYVRRWPTAFIVFHIWMMVTVLLLAGTGLPLHYAGEPWAMGLMNLFGGPVAAGWVHRLCAVLLAALGVAFTGYIAWRAFRKKERGIFIGPDSMMPRWKDVTDLIGMLRWFLFRGPQPRFDRWTYWEKFDFWAAGWGLFVIGLSGLVLWFPEQATRFVPGWFVNAALIIHGIEALLDVAFIFTVHAFHANLRPDKFPIDTMFLTGRIPEEEFRTERPAEYDRAVASGTLESLIADPPTRRLRIAAYVIGACALGVGFFFIAMMVAALLSR